MAFRRELLELAGQLEKLILTTFQLHFSSVGKTKQHQLALVNLAHHIFVDRPLKGDFSVHALKIGVFGLIRHVKWDANGDQILLVVLRAVQGCFQLGVTSVLQIVKQEFVPN